MRQAREKRRGAAEKEVHARLRPLARYQTQDAHEAWVGGLLLEGRLRARIQARLTSVCLGLGRIRQARMRTRPKWVGCCWRIACARASRRASSGSV